MKSPRPTSSAQLNIDLGLITEDLDPVDDGVDELADARRYRDG